MRHGGSLTVLALAAILGLAACAATETRGGQGLYRSRRYDEVRKLYEAGIVREPRNAALDRNEAGVMALLDGDVDGAHRHFRQAFDDLDDLSSNTAETVGAFAGSAASRRWKGEPYERCMNAYYLGVTYWLRGDADNAAASFKAGVLRDADSQHGAAQSDFSILWYLLGQAQRTAHHSDRGDAALRAAARLLPRHEQLRSGSAATGNVLVLVETGTGPRKLAEGPGGAWLRFSDRARGRGLVPRVTLANRYLGDTASLGDVFHQAMTRGEKVVDHVNKGKAVFAEAVKVAGAVKSTKARTDEERLAGVGAVLIGAAIPTEADTRTWRSLPGEVHALTADLPPGQHVLKIEFLNGGKADPSLTTEVPVTVRPGHVALAWGRAVPGYIVPRFR